MLYGLRWNSRTALPPNECAALVLTCFSGGLELLFSNQRKHQISLPAKDGDGQTANVAFLVRYLCQHLMKDRREELFVMDGTVFVDLILSEYESQGDLSAIGGPAYSF